MSKISLQTQVRVLIIFFMIALSISGLTAIPLGWEVNILRNLFGNGTWMSSFLPFLSEWIERVYLGVTETAKNHPFMLYGTDWLAFAHVVIAIAFTGPLRDPVKNIWVIEFGMIACILIIPWGIIFGIVRGIPSFWSLVDFSFGVFGFIPLWYARRLILQMSKDEK